MTDQNDFDRNLSYRAETEQREAELDDARSALAEATWLFHEARASNDYAGTTGGRSAREAAARVRVREARRRVRTAWWRGVWAGIRARLSGLMSL